MDKDDGVISGCHGEEGDKPRPPDPLPHVGIPHTPLVIVATLLYKLLNGSLYAPSGSLCNIYL